jgi:hypothetical protein
MRNTITPVILALALVGAPAAQARASDAGEPSRPAPRNERADVVPAPETELHAIEDTLRRSGPTASSADVAPSRPSAVEAELRALDDTVARSTERFGRDARANSAGPERVDSLVGSAQEAELRALLAWQRPGSIPEPGRSGPANVAGATAQLEPSRRAGPCTCMR